MAHVAISCPVSSWKSGFVSAPLRLAFSFPCLTLGWKLTLKRARCGILWYFRSELTVGQWSSKTCYIHCTLVIIKYLKCLHLFVFLSVRRISPRVSLMKFLNLIWIDFELDPDTGIFFKLFLTLWDWVFVDIFAFSGTPILIKTNSGMSLLYWAINSYNLALIQIC